MKMVSINRSELNFISIFFYLTIACGLINCASLGSSQVQFSGKCKESEYYDPVLESCRLFSGGGRVLYIEHNTTCDGFVGVKAYPETDKFYYVCQNDSVVIVECTGTLRFNSEKNGCEKSPCDSLQLPKCETAGNFVVPDIKFSCCYTCQEVNDKLVARSQPCSAYSTSRNKCTSSCKPATTEVKNGNSNGESANLVECYPPCSKPGQFRTPNNCSMYYTCSAKTNGRFYQTRLMCPAGFAYDITTEKCEPADRVNCKQMSVGELLNLYEFYKEERERKNCNGNNTNINSNIQSQIATQESQLEAQLTTLPDENGPSTESAVKQPEPLVTPVPTDSNSDSSTAEAQSPTEVIPRNINNNRTDQPPQSHSPQTESQLKIGAESLAVPTSSQTYMSTFDSTSTPATTSSSSNSDIKVGDLSDSPTTVANSSDLSETSIPTAFSTQRTRDPFPFSTQQNMNSLTDQNEINNLTIIESSTSQGMTHWIDDHILGLIDPSTLPTGEPMLATKVTESSLSSEETLLGSTNPDSTYDDEPIQMSTSIITTTQTTVNSSTVETAALANNLESSDSLKKDAESQYIASTTGIPMDPTMRIDAESQKISSTTDMPMDPTFRIDAESQYISSTTDIPMSPTMRINAEPQKISNSTDMPMSPTFTIDAESQYISSTTDIPMSPTMRINAESQKTSNSTDMPMIQAWRNEQLVPSSTASPTESSNPISSVEILAPTRTERVQNSTSEVSTAYPSINAMAAKETPTGTQCSPFETTPISIPLTSPQTLVNVSSETLTTDIQNTEITETMAIMSTLSSILMDPTTTPRPQSSQTVQALPPSSTEYPTRIEKGNQTEMVDTQDFRVNINETGNVHEVKMYFKRHTKVILEFDPDKNCTEPEKCGPMITSDISTV